MLDHVSAAALRRARSALDLIGAPSPRRYSITAAIRAAMDNRLSGGSFEADEHQRLVSEYGATRTAHSIRVSLQDLKRDMTVGTSTAGGFLVESDVVPAYVPALRARTAAFRLGAELMPDLKGAVTIPRGTATVTPTWLANEGSTVTEGTPTMGQVAMSPKTVGVYVESSRQLLTQAPPQVDNLFASDLLGVVGVAIDTAVLNGSGASGQPTGILQTAGTGTFSGTTLNLAGLCNAQEDVLNAGAGTINPDTLAFLTTPAVATTLSARLKTGANDTMVWNGPLIDGQIIGVKSSTSTLLPAASAIYGDWSQVVVGLWGSIEIEVNPVAGFSAGIVGFRVLASIDVAIRQPGSFSVSSSIT